MQSSPSDREQASNEHQFVETCFGEGALGVTLRRRPEDGIVFIHDIVPHSQAVYLNVQPNDELWSVGESEIGTTPLDKEAWNGLITFIKQSARPLRFVWKRKLHPVTTTDQVGTTIVPCVRNTAFVELERLVNRFICREKEPYKKVFMIDPAQVLREGRQIQRQGDLLVEARLSMYGKNPLWVKTGGSLRRVILCNDLLLVAVLLNGNVLAPEFILELQACKLRSVGHVFNSSSSNDISTVESPSNTFRCSFEVIFPGGEIVFFTENTATKDVWILNIYLALCESTGESSRVLGWRHQLMLGTMHSAVICRDEDLLKELITLCEGGKLDFLAIESVDEDGYTPLHYACMLRLRSMVKILHEATADVTVTDNFRFTPLHWTALQLDDISLSLLCTHVFDIDLYDDWGRTPLVIACIEGRDLSGKTDSLILRKCVECMLPHKPNLNYTDAKGQTLLHYLAASWQFEAMELLLNASSNDINSRDTQYFMTPLHYASHAVPIKRAVGDAARVMNGASISDISNKGGDSELEELNHPHGAETLRALLQFGAKPNCKDLQGRTPLMILLEDETQQRWTRKELEAAVCVMLSHGARIDDATNSCAPMGNSIRTKFPDLNVDALIEKWNLLPALDCSKLNINLHHFECASENVATSSSKRENASSTSLTCSLCGFTYTMFRRQHHCRLCNESTCDDCSKKKVIVENAQVRCCDGCYNRALTVQKQVNQEEVKNSTSQLMMRSASENDELMTSKKTKLFSSSEGKGSVTSKSETVSRGVRSTANILSETHENLQHRGQKLSELTDRTSQLSNQANEFARMARQLNEQQKSRWF